MKKIALSFFAWCASATFCGSLLAGDSSQLQELQFLFHQDFLEATDNHLLDLAVCRTFASAESGMAPGELKDRFKHLACTPEGEQRFLSIYASMLDDNELHEACSLIQDERYLKYRTKLAMANYLCYKESAAVLGGIVSTFKTVEAEEPLHPILHVHENDVR